MTIASGYLPILLMILLGMLLAGTFTVVGLYLGPRLRSKVKDTPFESGFVRDGTEGSRYDVKFYMTALVFLVFDLSGLKKPGTYLTAKNARVRQLKITAIITLGDAAIITLGE